jgi:putative transcriptional regulator
LFSNFEIKELKNLIKVERARNNLTQADLAVRVKVSRQTINSIEVGRFVPSTVLALKIARMLEIKIDDLFELESEDWEPS